MLNAKLLHRLPNYLKRFGVLSGFRLAWKVESKVTKNTQIIKPYNVPGYKNPIYLRDTVSDHATFWQCIVMEQYTIDRFPHAERLQKTYKQAVLSGKQPIIVDCGGNIGLSTLWFARAFPQARIVVVEPNLENHELLKKNTAHLREQVTTVQGGVWSRSGWLKIVNPDSGSAAFRVESSDKQDSSALRAYTVEELYRLGGEGELIIVKLDIEGSQKHLFSENTGWVSMAHLITLELDDWLMPWKGTSRAFFSCLSEYPFEYLLGDESIFCFQDMAISRQDLC